MSPPPLPRPWSMTARLITLQVFAVALLVGGAEFVVYQQISRHLAADNRLELENQRLVLTRWIVDSASRGAFETGELRATSRLLASLNDLHVRVLDRAGRSLLENVPGSGPALPPFPPTGTGAHEARDADGTHFLLRSDALPIDAPEGPAVLQLAANVEDDDILRGHIRERMLLAFAVTIVASGVLAAFIARAVFRPVARLSRTVAEVSPSRLDTRIAATGWPAELVDLAHELDQLLVRLDESFRRLARFSADLSHELRTPISTLRGEAEVALTRERTPEEYRRVLESNLEECGRLARLIDMLLFVAKADHPAHGVALHPLDAAEVCRAVADFYEPLASERGLTLLVRGAGCVVGDAELLRRAVANLVDNAVKNTPSGGHIDLTVRTDPVGATEIEVRDSGRGILETDMPRVFERFYRSESQTGDKGAGGFGLGLSIVRSIMELHRGTAAIASVPQAGTTVTLRFPPPEAAS